MKKEIKLNIGCGPCGLGNWINYDYGILPLMSKFSAVRNILIKMGLLSDFYKRSWPDIKLVDIRKRFPINNGTVKFIYCSQVLEHFEYWEALKILKECHRCLERGGVMRISVPDVRKMISIYQEELGVDGDNAARDLCRLWWGVEKDIAPSGFIARISRFFIRDHKWHYDVRSMEMLCREAGFDSVTMCDFKKGTVPDIDKLDIDEHRKHSLYVEITK